MTELAWLSRSCFLHVIGAIAGFGPSFAFPIIGAMGGAEREHGNFATRISETISGRLVYPHRDHAADHRGGDDPRARARPDVEGELLARRGDRPVHHRLRLLVLRPAQDGRAGRRADLRAAAARRQRTAAGTDGPREADPARRDGADGPAARDHLPDGGEAGRADPGPRRGASVYHSGRPRRTEIAVHAPRRHDRPRAPRATRRRRPPRRRSPDRRRPGGVPRRRRPRPRLDRGVRDRRPHRRRSPVADPRGSAGAGRAVGEHPGAVRRPRPRRGPAGSRSRRSTSGRRRSTWPGRCTRRPRRPTSAR